jgi:predicted  nucleic acid-binding Zn-ribbon protein
MSQSLSLYRLQQIDSQIDRIKNRLQTIHKTLDDDSDIRVVKEAAARSEEAKASAEATLKKAEKDMQDLQIKIEQVDSSLYGSAAHSPKELQDLQNDLAALKKHRSTLEDAQLNSMIALELAEKENSEANGELEKVRDFKDGQNRELINEQESLSKELEKLTVERQAVAGALPEPAIRQYEQLRQQKRGLAIATISDNSCDACGSTLSLAQIQSARSSSQMATCPSCGRILYAN